MSKYLSAVELADLVGCKMNQRKIMQDWLNKNHWRYETDKTGLPKVAKAFHDKKLGIAEEKTKHQYDDSPNFNAFAEQKGSHGHRPSL
jgi:hypothetical protein